MEMAFPLAVNNYFRIFLNTMSLAEHQQVIDQFRERLVDVIRDSDTDLYLYKWLKARSFNLDKAEKMFRKSREYMDTMNIQQIRNEYQPPEVIRKYLSGGLLGFDKEGSPIKIELFGHLDMKGMIYSTKMSDLEKTKLMQCEEIVDIWKEQSNKLNRQVDGLTVIFDMDNVGLTALWKPGVQMYLHLVDVLENNYPEMMKHLFVINASLIFPMLWKISQPLLSEDMRTKIHILGGRYKEHLLKYIDASQLPVFLGGTMIDPVDGGDRCTSLICPGGEIPKSYYLNENPEYLLNLEQKDIGKGEEFLLDFEVEHHGSVLKWEFRTTEHDLGFGVTRTDPAAPGKEVTVVAPRRVTCNIYPYEGSVVCDVVGKYTVRFDNTYSWMTKKHLQYLVELHSSGGEMPIDLDTELEEDE